jgi:hypothetical protein
MFLTIGLFLNIGCGEMQVSQSLKTPNPSSELDQLGESDRDTTINEDVRQTMIATAHEGILEAIVGNTQGTSKASFAGPSLAPQSFQISKTLDCPDGGTLAVEASGTVNFSKSQTEISIEASLESGSVKINNCTMDGNVASGALKLGETELKGVASMKGDQLKIDGSAVGSVNGEISVLAADGTSYSCKDIDLAGAGELHANINLSSSSGTVAVKGVLKGKACGKVVDESIDEVITI